MLVIRKEQMQVFREQMLKQFEDRMVGHLASRFPQTWANANEAAIRESIQKGIKRAGSYGITKEYDVARYIDLMLRFSDDFDTNPNTSWAAPILKDPNAGSRDKMDQLCEHADQHFTDSLRDTRVGR